MLHFAYGSNMNLAVMRRHAPLAVPLGVARLPGHRFVIAANGYASVKPACERSVYGVLWRLTPRDKATLDSWENVAGGEYVTTTLPVEAAGRRRLALVYLARVRRHGRAKAGYMEVVIAAAREWQLPQAHIGALLVFLPRAAAGRAQARRFLRGVFHGRDP